MDKKTLFRVALAVAGITAADYARMVGVAPATLSLYLSGKTVSRPLDEKTDSFITENLQRLREIVTTKMAA